MSFLTETSLGDSALHSLLHSVNEMRMDQKDAFERGYMMGQINLIKTFMPYDPALLAEVEAAIKRPK